MAEVRDRRGHLTLDTMFWWSVGGAAGVVAAAFTAARAGCPRSAAGEVRLLRRRRGLPACRERSAVSMPRPKVRQSRPNKWVFGFADRFIDVMKAKGGITEPQRYGNTYTLTHDPLVWREAGDHFLADAGVQVLFHPPSSTC